MLLLIISSTNDIACIGRTWKIHLKYELVHNDTADKHNN